MLKEDFAYAMLVIDLIIFVVWPFLVFFHFIWVGLVILTVCGLLSAILYEIYRGIIATEHKIVATEQKIVHKEN